MEENDGPGVHMLAPDSDHEDVHMMAATLGSSEDEDNNDHVPPEMMDEEEAIMLMHSREDNAEFMHTEVEEPAVFLRPEESVSTLSRRTHESFLRTSSLLDAEDVEQKDRVIPVIPPAPPRRVRSSTAEIPTSLEKPARVRASTDENPVPDKPPPARRAASHNGGSPLPGSSPLTVNHKTLKHESPGSSLERKSPGSSLGANKSFTASERSSPSRRSPVHDSDRRASPTASTRSHDAKTPTVAAAVSGDSSFVDDGFSPPSPNKNINTPVLMTPPPEVEQEKSKLPTIPDGTTPIVLETPQAYRKARMDEPLEQREQSSPRSGGFFRSRWSKWFIFYTVCVTAAFIYFVFQYSQIPGLKEQVEALSGEVDRLEGQVDELEIQIDRLNSTIGNLTQEVDELSQENDRLQASNNDLQANNIVLKQSVEDLQEEVDTLRETLVNLTQTNEELKETALQLEVANAELQNTTQTLNATNAELTAQVANLTTVNEFLETSNRQYQNQTGELQESLQEVIEEYNEAQETVAALEEQVQVLQEENEQLQNLTDTLSTIASFLDDTGQELDISFEELAAQLDEQIDLNRVLVLEQMQNTMIQRMQTWNCDFVNAFAGDPFADSLDVPLSGNYDEVMDYVEDRVLTDACLDRSDFEIILAVNFQPDGADPPTGITAGELVSGVSQYMSDAMNYYFPDDGESGVTPQEWADASYDCDNLPLDRQYRVA